MRIVLQEMKKIWNIKTMLIVVLLCALLYLMFMEFEIANFPNGHSATEEVEYSIQLTQEYGPTLEEAEYSEFMEKTYVKLISEAENHIQNMPIFAQAGIHTYADYEKVYEKGDQTDLENSAIWTLLGEECGFVRFKLQALDRIKERYYDYPGHILRYLAIEDKSEKEITRLMEIRETKEYRNIMDEWVFENTVTYTTYLAILAVLAVLVFVSPLIVTDRARKVHLLQYTAKRGRRILKEQLIAVILSAFLLTTALILVFGAIYSTNGTWLFWNNGLTSFLNYNVTFFWFDLTYGQYIAVSIALIYTLCVGAAAIAFFLSRFSQNLIALILKLIPVFAMLGGLAYGVFTNTYSDANPLYVKTGIIGIEHIACGIVLIAGLAASLFMVRRERKVDVP